ncbi:hypothetical protein ACTPC6_18865 [Clostridioides difficile]
MKDNIQVKIIYGKNSCDLENNLNKFLNSIKGCFVIVNIFYVGTKCSCGNESVIVQYKIC